MQVSFDNGLARLGDSCSMHASTPGHVVCCTFGRLLLSACKHFGACGLLHVWATLTQCMQALRGMWFAARLGDSYSVHASTPGHVVCCTFGRLLLSACKHSGACGLLHVWATLTQCMQALRGMWFAARLGDSYSVHASTPGHVVCCTFGRLLLSACKHSGACGLLHVWATLTQCMQALRGMWFAARLGDSYSVHASTPGHVVCCTFGRLLLSACKHSGACGLLHVWATLTQCMQALRGMWFAARLGDSYSVHASTPGHVVCCTFGRLLLSACKHSGACGLLHVWATLTQCMQALRGMCFAARLGDSYSVHASTPGHVVCCTFGRLLLSACKHSGACGLLHVWATLTKCMQALRGMWFAARLGDSYSVHASTPGHVVCCTFGRLLLSACKHFGACGLLHVWATLTQCMQALRGMWFAARLGDSYSMHASTPGHVVCCTFGRLLLSACKHSGACGLLHVWATLTQCMQALRGMWFAARLGDSYSVHASTSGHVVCCTFGRLLLSACKHFGACGLLHVWATLTQCMQALRGMWFAARLGDSYSVHASTPGHVVCCTFGRLLLSACKHSGACGLLHVWATLTQCMQALRGMWFATRLGDSYSVHASTPGHVVCCTFGRLLLSACKHSGACGLLHVWATLTQCMQALRGMWFAARLGDSYSVHASTPGHVVCCTFGRLLLSACKHSGACGLLHVWATLTQCMQALRGMWFAARLGDSYSVHASTSGHVVCRTFGRLLLSACKHFGACGLLHVWATLTQCMQALRGMWFAARLGDSYSVHASTPGHVVCCNPTFGTLHSILHSTQADDSHFPAWSICLLDVRQGSWYQPGYGPVPRQVWAWHYSAPPPSWHVSSDACRLCV